MKISWGTKVIIIFSVFASGIIGMVVISFSRNIDLVSEHYYEQEIKYQHQIDLIKSSKLLDENLKVYQQHNDVILEIVNPKVFNNPEGEIYFYRSSDAGLDFKVAFKFSSSGLQTISHKNFEKSGLWKIKLNLKDGDKRYYAEKSIHVGKYQ